MRRSEPITWDQMRVGFVLIVSLVLLALCVLFVGRIGDVFGERYQLVALMESASGLRPGAPVQVAGRGVGQVERVEFIAPEERGDSEAAVAVWLGVNVDVREQIRRGSRARVRTQGLLGDRLIDIEPGSPDSAVLVPGDTIGTAPALSYDELLGQAADAVPRSHAALERSFRDAGARLERRGFAWTPPCRRSALRRPRRPQREPRGRAGTDRGRGGLAGPPARGSGVVRPPRVLHRPLRHGDGGAGGRRRDARADAGVGLPVSGRSHRPRPGPTPSWVLSRTAKGRLGSSSATRRCTKSSSRSWWT